METDPSANSDLKGHAVGIRFADTHDILSPARGDKPEIPKQNLGAIFPRLDRSIFPRLEDERMCWFSAEHADEIEEAKAGQRLVIRKMNWHANWVVRETELETARPCPVCLIDQTRVLFRFSESQQASLHLGSEAEAVFKMLERPKRDIFEFADGRQITLGALPAGLILDVLVVPGAEQLSAVLEKEAAVQHEEESEKESFLVRLLARF